MNRSELKKKAFSGVLWKTLEYVGSQGVSLVVSIVLARLLTVSDYSVVGVVAIFFAFCNIFVTGGFNAALIQKKDADKIDYSSVLWVSVLIAVVLYFVLFFSAPWIADVYQKPLLTPVFRVMGVTIIVEAVRAVLSAYVSNKLAFKSFFFATTGGTLLSAVIGIVMAMQGFGPWALVIQRLGNSTINTIVLFFMTKFLPTLKISYERIKKLFGYGWKIFVSSIISTAYEQINPLVIGLKFSAEDLSLYTKGQSFPALLNDSASGAFSTVLFPVIAKVQDSKTEVLNYTRKFMQVASFVVFPLMIGFFAVSDNFVLAFLTEKWMPAAVYIKIFCVTYMFNIVQIGNLQTIRAIGRSDMILKMEIIKKSLYFVVILVAVFISDKPESLAVATIVNTIIATIVNSTPNRKLIGYQFKDQLMDLLPNFLQSVLMGAVVISMNLFKMNALLLMGAQIFVGILVYIALSVVFKNSNLLYLLQTMKSFLKKNN